jgi:hypothetical protein
VMYTPHARVHHRVEAFRVRKSYFRRWRFQGSRRQAQLEDVPAGRRVGGVPPYLILQLFRAALRSVVAYLLRPSDEAFRQEITMWHFIGLIAGVRDRYTHTKHNESGNA